MLDTLGDDLDLERVGHRDDRAGDGAGLAIAIDVGDERAVDLQEVER